MSDGANKSKRPIAVTLLCIFMAIGGSAAIATLFTSVYEQLPAWYRYVAAVSTALGLVVVVGLWRMMRWAVMLYAIATIVGQFLAVAAGQWVSASLIYPLIAFAIMARYYREME